MKKIIKILFSLLLIFAVTGCDIDPITKMLKNPPENFHSVDFETANKMFENGETFYFILLSSNNSRCRDQVYTLFPFLEENSDIQAYAIDIAKNSSGSFKDETLKDSYLEDMGKMLHSALLRQGDGSLYKNGEYLLATNSPIHARVENGVVEGILLGELYQEEIAGLFD